MDTPPQRPLGRPPGVRADGDRLRRIRRYRGLTMKELGHSIGHGYKIIWRAERGEPISDKIAWLIARELTRIGPPVTPRDFIPGWPQADGSEPDTTAEALAS